METLQDTSHDVESAAEYVTVSVPCVGPDETIGQVWTGIRGDRYETVSDIAVLHEGMLVGLVRIEDLIAANDGATVASIMDDAPPVVVGSEDREIAACHAVEHGESSLAVLDSEGRFHGVIPPTRLLAILLAEHHEDLARLGGYLHSTTLARRAGLESVPRRFAHRIPWLLLGLGGALLAALIIGAFEARLQANVTLAFFIPGIVYLADAVGTQTETVVIRGLSVGVGIRDVIGREIMTGIAVGAVIATVFFPVAVLVWSDLDIAIAVSLALLAACSIATLVALGLPSLLAKLGSDPAFGSGPVATVVQDLLSITIYFGIVLWIVP